MLFIINGFSFYIILFSSSVHAATTYNFTTRYTGINALACEGIILVFLPSNNTFQFNLYGNSEYTHTSVNKALELNVDIESPSGKVVDAWSKLDNLSAAGKIRAHHS